jgi:4-hydroxy-3-methylbut-2-en-1-yl diphosphate synthase IspG/GcpE
MGIHKLRLNPGNIGADWKVRRLPPSVKEKVFR